MCLVQVRRRILHPQNELVGQTEDTLASSYHLAGASSQAQMHCRASLGVISASYPADSLQVAFQKVRLASLSGASPDWRNVIAGQVCNTLHKQFGQKFGSEVYQEMLARYDEGVS